MELMPRCLSYFFFFVILNLSYLSAMAFSPKDSLLNALNQTLAQKTYFTQLKLDKIQALKQAMEKTPPTERFNHYFAIYDSYKTVIKDSAFLYARKLQTAAYANHDQAKIALARMELSFVLLSSGMFKETLDTLLTIKSHTLPDTLKKRYYGLMARTYYDLIDFNQDAHYTEPYLSRANLYIDSALTVTHPGTADHQLLLGTRHMKALHWKKARDIFKNVILQYSLSDPDLAVAASTLGYIYQQLKQQDQAITYLCIAAMADVRASTKETLAILNLAELLYHNGKIKLAYAYVKQALDDANFYDARHRKIQVASIFPKIEGDELNTLEWQRKLLFLYAIAVTALIIILMVLAWIIFKQFKKIRTAKATISQVNQYLQEVNLKLQEGNLSLREANKIKEEYIGYYFNINTEYVQKLEGLKQSVNNKLIAKKFEDIRFVINKVNLKKEREELFFSFDKVFVKLFPDFVSSFNALFKEGDRVVLKEGQLLTTEQRIFALIRMGIHDTDKIAKTLNYSVNTIYAYKNRVKSKSIIPNEEFEKHIMAIKAI